MSKDKRKEQNEKKQQINVQLTISRPQYRSARSRDQLMWLVQSVCYKVCHHRPNEQTATDNFHFKLNMAGAVLVLFFLVRILLCVVSLLSVDARGRW